MIFRRKNRSVDCKKNHFHHLCKRSIKRERERETTDSNLNCSLDKNKNLKQCRRKPHPLIPYFGGKQKVADKIISQFPEHDVFIEPFIGGGSIYWKNTIPKKFIINDLNKDVYNIYKTAKSNPSAMKRCKINKSKESFNKIKNKSNKSACDTINIYKNSYGAIGKSYAKSRNYKNQFDDQHIEKLSKTTVLNQDYKKVIQKNANKNSLVYMDPPYVEAGNSYITHGVTPEEVCNVAQKIKGKVAISYDNNQTVKKSCQRKGLKFRKITVPYTAKKGKTVKKQELLITNY